MLYQSVVKRSVDFSIALIGCVLLSPVCFTVFILLLFKYRGSPFFCQVRPGKNEQLFKIVKFKTMNDKRDLTGALLPDKERLTTVGKFLRKTSLDEIPQLINVLKLEECLSYLLNAQAVRTPTVTGISQSITSTQALTRLFFFFLLLVFFLL